MKPQPDEEAGGNGLPRPRCGALFLDFL